MYFRVSNPPNRVTIQTFLITSNIHVNYFGANNFLGLVDILNIDATSNSIVGYQ